MQTDQPASGSRNPIKQPDHTYVAKGAETNW
jgi:hypothetical protein